MSIVEGAISVKATLESKYRKVNKVYLDDSKQNSDIDYIIALCKKNHIEVIKQPRQEIEKLANGKTHGGILADVENRKLQSVMSLLAKEKPFLVLLEGIEDSFNFGYMLRTLYAFGCDGVILNNHDYDFSDPTLIKSSAGASEKIAIVNSDDIETLLQTLKENNIEIVSAYRGKNPIDLYDFKYQKKGYCFAIGGPLRGLSKVVLDNSDYYIYIPYANDFKNALNAASAVSVISSEVYRNCIKK